MSSPFLVFLAIFVLAPLAELYLLIEVGSEIGALPTIGLSIFTALLGGTLVRYQGLSVLFRAQAQLARESVPAIELMEGATLLLVGFALLLPGFITDAIGFLLLITPIRRGLIIWYMRRRGVMRPGGGPPRGPNGPPGAPDAEKVRRIHIIDGEYHRDD